MFLVAFVDVLTGHAGHGNAANSNEHRVFVVFINGLKRHAGRGDSVKHNGKQYFLQSCPMV